MTTATTPNTDTEGGTMDTLTTPKHTPGPWTLHPGAGKKSERYIWREAPYPGGQCVAAVYPGITGEDERALDYPWSSRQEAADATAGSPWPGEAAKQ